MPNVEPIRHRGQDREASAGQASSHRRPRSRADLVRAAICCVALLLGGLFLAPASSSTSDGEAGDVTNHPSAPAAEPFTPRVAPEGMPSIYIYDPTTLGNNCREYVENLGQDEELPTPALCGWSGWSA